MPHTRRRNRAILAVAAAVVLGLPADSTAAAACWLPPVEAPVSDPFRQPPCRWCPGNRGIEFATEPGTPVRAVAAGTVSYAGSIADRIYVVVRHADGRRATYGDLAERRVARGDTVLTGMVVGTARERFHFGLRDGDRYIDPAPFLGRRVGRPRLVPTDGSAAAPPPPPRLSCAPTPRRPSIGSLRSSPSVRGGPGRNGPVPR